MKIVQTAGRAALGEFAPEFAHFNDDVLFGENWNNQDIDVKTRSIITVVALMSSGITDSSLKYHLANKAGVVEHEKRITKGANVYTILITNSDGIDEDARIYADDIYYVNRKEYVDWAIKALTVV